MDTSKLSDWLQIVAAAGVIAGLALVAYELRISNRIGYEQANYELFNMWAEFDRANFSPELTEIRIRDGEGEQLTRIEASIIDAYFDSVVEAIQYEMLLRQTGTSTGDYRQAMAGIAQINLGSANGQRYWANNWADYSPWVTEVIDEALSAADQANYLSYLDYIRGATDQRE